MSQEGQSHTQFAYSNYLLSFLSNKEKSIF